MAGESEFEPIEFHGRHTHVVLFRDAWGPCLRISLKKRGIYKLLVKRFGSHDPLLKKRIQVNNPGKDILLRLPMGLSNECLQKTWIKISPTAQTF
jgi:hypothetical protein